jgi:hypothetical protein
MVGRFRIVDGGRRVLDALRWLILFALTAGAAALTMPGCAHVGAIGGIVLPAATYQQLKSLEAAVCVTEPPSDACLDVRAELAKRPAPEEPPTSPPVTEPPSPPPTTPPGTQPPIPPTPGALMAGDQPQGREWEPAPEDAERLARLSGRVETVLREMATSYGCENDDCRFPKLPRIVDGKLAAPNGTRALAEVVSKLRASGLHAGRGNDDRSCIDEPWPAHCADDQASVTEGDPADVATVWENVQPVNMGSPVKLRLKSMTQLDEHGVRKLSAWVQKGDVEPPPVPTPSACGDPDPLDPKWQIACVLGGHWNPKLYNPRQQIWDATWVCDIYYNDEHPEWKIVSHEWCVAIGMGYYGGTVPRGQCPLRDENKPAEREACEARVYGSLIWKGDGNVEKIEGQPTMARCLDCSTLSVCWADGTHCKDVLK